MAGEILQSESAKSIRDPSEELRVVQLTGLHRLVNHREASFQEVGQQDPEHPDRQAGLG